MGRMHTKKSSAGGTLSGPKSGRQPTGLSPKKKCVAVDQYIIARTLLREIPTQVPRKGEIVPQPATLPLLVQQTAPNEWKCEVCRAMCTSFTALKHHQAGKSHRKHVLIRNIQLNRYFAVGGWHENVIF